MQEPNPSNLSPVPQRSFYIIVSTVFLSMSLTLFASEMRDDHWFRYFAKGYLIVMQILFLVFAFRAPKINR